MLVSGRVLQKHKRWRNWGYVVGGVVFGFNSSHEPEPWNSLRTGVGKNHSNFHVCNDLEPSNCLDLIQLPGFVEVVDSIQEKKETSCCHYEESICRLSMCAYWRTKGFAVCTCGAAGWKFVSPILWSQNFIVVIPWPKHRLFLGWMIPNPRKNGVLSPEIHEEIYSISMYKLFQVLFLNWSLKYICEGFPICNILHSSTFQGCRITIRPIVTWWKNQGQSKNFQTGRNHSHLFYGVSYIQGGFSWGTSVATAALPPSKSRQNPPRQLCQDTSPCRSSRSGCGRSTSTSSARWK